MSTMWLNKKKKGELVALCDHLGLETDGYLKSDLESILIKYLEANESKHSTDSLLAPYYDTVVNTRSPTKSMIALHELPEKRTRRRTSRYVAGTSNSFDNRSTEESTPEPVPQSERKTRAGSRALATRTPRTVRNLRDAAHVPLPPSPAVVADEIESRTNQIIASAKETIEKVEIVQTAEGLRDRLSNVISVNAIALALEVLLLFMTVIPRAYEVTVPAVATLGTKTTTFFVPDFFVLVSSVFWSPFLTWLSTAFIGPYINAMLFNLVATTVTVKDGNEHQTKADPLTFAVTKALLTYLVHYKGYSFLGLFGEDAIKTVGNSVGRELQLVAAGIAGLAAIWEGILRR